MRGFQILIKISVLILLSNCSGSTVSVRDEPISSPKTVSCYFISNEKDYNACLECANQGDAEAAFKIAEIHDEFEFRWVSNIKKDRTKAFYWYKRAADLGHEKAVRLVFDSYYFGRYTPENKLEAKRYLEQAAMLGHEWAILLLAHWTEDKYPEKAIDQYLELARKDNCHAQRELARIYYEGKIIPQDICKSYFWGLVANVGWPLRHSDNHLLVKGSSITNICSSVSNYKIENEIGPNYVQIVQEAASKRKKGNVEPEFPLVQSKVKEKETISQISPPHSLDISKQINIDKPIKWTPIHIDFSKRQTTDKTAAEVFNMVNRSVWIVISAASAANLKSLNSISLGSAVVISENKLLTNYHVIDGKPYVAIKKGDRFEKASIISGDRQTDRCVLKVESVKLEPVKGFKKYDDVVIGESVYSIGSPKGLENTLGGGIISGKRERGKLRLIQTTAQISKGSSGGGLFDRLGNLMGITAFKLADSEALNFAISIDNFTQ